MQWSLVDPALAVVGYGLSVWLSSSLLVRAYWLARKLFGG